MLALMCMCALLASGIAYSVEAGGLQLVSLDVDPDRVTGGGALQATVTLNDAAPEGGVVVPLASSDASVARVPESVLIPAGATSGTFEVSTAEVSDPVSVKIIARYEGKRAARVTVLPAGAAEEGVTLESVILSAAGMEDGGLHGVVMLSAPAPPGGAVVFLSSDDLSAVFPATVTIPEGETSATFTVERPADMASAPITVSASYGNTTRSASHGQTEVEAQAITAYATGNQYYVAPNGSSRGKGTMSSPWDLQTALNHPSAVKPGDTIWLRGGTYGSGNKTVFTSKLTGTASAPIIVRQYGSERATVNGGIRVNGAHTWFWGFEITNTYASRDVSDINGRPVGLSVYANGFKAINLIIHNVGRAGIGFWPNITSGYTGEIYGVIFWGNGIYHGDTIRGDSIYTHMADRSASSPRIIAETISFRNFNLGVKVYSEWDDRFVNGYQLIGNVAFDHRGYNIVADHTRGGMAGFKAISNFTYQKRTESRNNMKFGTSGKTNKDAIIQDNYFVAGRIGLGALYVNGFTNLVATGNTAVSASIIARWNPPSTTPSVTWNNNSYHGGSSSPFKYKNTGYSFDRWKSMTRFDGNSTKSGYPTQARVFVRPNKYEKGRGHIIVYNWPRSSSVSVNLSSLLQSGQAYEIRDAQNYFGAPVVSGTYNGGTVSLPMNRTAVAPILGERHISNVHTDAEFGVFVVIPK